MYRIGDNIKKYRSEWKYILNNQQLSLLKSRVSEVLDIDPNAPDSGRYIIHSLYFDDYKDISVYDVDAGISKRYKWRIRYYDDDLNYIVLEKKEKIQSRCCKRICKITIDEYFAIVKGNITDIVYDTDKQLIKELAVDMLTKNFVPKIIVSYERMAFVEDTIDVRVTLDMKICASYELEKFLTGNYSRYYIQPSNFNVLEVKFDEILPSYIRNIVESHEFKQTFFSKYYYGRKIIDSYMR